MKWPYIKRVLLGLLAYSVFSLNLGWSTFFSFPGQQNEKRKSRTHEETRTASSTSSWTPASWPESKKLFSARSVITNTETMMFATSKKATHQRGKHTKPRTLTYRRFNSTNDSTNHRVDAAFAPTCTNIKAGNTNADPSYSPLYEVKAAFLSTAMSVCTLCRSDPGLL